MASQHQHAAPHAKPPYDKPVVHPGEIFPLIFGI